ncbi:MAG: YceI family protein [Burkholderiales bacterium]
MTLVPLVLVAALCTAASVLAAEFRQLDPAASQVSFTSRQMGVPVDGRFRKFESTLLVDPAAPQSAKGKVTIDLASIDTGLKEANEEVVGASWFDVSHHPTATFDLGKIEPAGNSRFQVAGVLTLRGVTKLAAFEAELKSSADRAVLEGSLPIKRLDFGVGQGGWGSTDVVANEVIVRFKLVLLP